MDGWIKLHRKIWDNPIVTKDSDHLAVWVWLLTHATHRERDVLFEGKRITLSAGELVCGRKMIAKETGVSESKVYRILKTFKIEQQIEQRTDRQKSVISIVRWNENQQSEQQSEQRLNNDRTTTEQRLNTKKERKEYKERENDLYSLRDEVTKTMAPEHRENLRLIREKIKEVNGRRKA